MRAELVEELTYFLGDWRILFDIEPEKRRVLVHDVLRRTSTTN
jgi:hypothetical protein